MDLDAQFPRGRHDHRIRARLPGHPWLDRLHDGSCAITSKACISLLFASCGCGLGTDQLVGGQKHARTQVHKKYSSTACCAHFRTGCDAKCDSRASLVSVLSVLCTACLSSQNCQTFHSQAATFPVKTLHLDLVHHWGDVGKRLPGASWCAGQHVPPAQHAWDDGLLDPCRHREVDGCRNGVGMQRFSSHHEQSEYWLMQGI